MASSDLDYEKKNILLERTSPQLKTRLNPILKDLSDELVSLGVLRYDDHLTIQSCQDPGAKYAALFNHLRAVGVNKFIKFCLLLVDRFDRGDIITEIFQMDIGSLRNQLSTVGGLSAGTGGKSSQPNQSGPKRKINKGELSQQVKFVIQNNRQYLMDNLKYSLSLWPLSSKSPNKTELETVFVKLSTSTSSEYLKFAKRIITTGQWRHLTAIGIDGEYIDLIKEA